MGNFGRYVCVAVPFLITLASLAALLAAGLAGISDKSLYMFEVNATKFTISSTQVSSLLHTRTLDAREPVPSGKFHDYSLIDGSGGSGGSGGGSHDKPDGKPDTSNKGSTGTAGTNITGTDLGLYDLYDVSLWGYCYTAHNGTRECTKPTFNWAETALNTTKSNVDSLITATGKNITLPSGVNDAIKAFSALARWTEIVFILACIALGIELVFGFFANCSRVFSCITFIIAGVAAVFVCGFAAMATAMSVVVVGSVEGTAKWYGVNADFNKRFLATVWLAALFALSSGFFWMFTCCCCAPDHSRRSSRHRHERGGDREKLMPAGAYVNINEHGHGHGGYNGAYHGGAQPQFNYAHGAPAAQRQGAYEPYSHSNV